jgi:hypothetical protein
MKGEGVGREFVVATKPLEGEADMNRLAKLAGSIANDPKQTSVTSRNSSKMIQCVIGVL